MDAWDEIAAVGRMTDFFLKFIASLPRDELCIWTVGLGKSKRYCCNHRELAGIKEKKIQEVYPNR